VVPAVQSDGGAEAARMPGSVAMEVDADDDVKPILTWGDRA
jgi:hypothetical protein